MPDIVSCPTSRVPSQSNRSVVSNPSEERRARRSMNQRRQRAYSAAMIISNSSNSSRTSDSEGKPGKRRPAMQRSRHRRVRAAKRTTRSSRRSHKAAGSGGSMGVSLNPASNGFGEMRTMHERLPSRTLPDRLRVKDPQPCLTATRAIDAICWAQVRAPDPVHLWSSTRLRQPMPNTFTRNRPLPFYHACAEDEWSRLNDPVIYLDHIETPF